MRNSRLVETQAGIKIAGRNINNHRYADDTTLKEEKWKRRRTQEPLDKVKEGNEKCWLKTQHSKTKIMASSPITSWQIDGEKVETVTDFIFLVSKITADGDCRHEIKRCLLLEKKKKTAMANLGSILKSKDITLPAKVHIVKAMLFSNGHVLLWVLDYKEGWVPKNWCFQIVVLEKTLESPLDFKKIKPVNTTGNQPWILIGRTDAEAKAPILWPADANSQLIGKVLDAGKDSG